MQPLSMLEHLSIPILWVDDSDRVGWWNAAAQEHFTFLTSYSDWTDVRTQLPEGYIFHIHEKTCESDGFLVECHPDTAGVLVERLRELRDGYAQLELIFSEAFDEVYVTDGDGITLRVNKAAERLYGMRTDELIGKSVFELERDGVFYPSVTGLALKQRKQITVLQTTYDGKQLMTTANPVFNEDGEITFVISTAKDVSESSLRALMANTTPSIQTKAFQAPPELQFSIVHRSAKMASLLKLARRVAETDTSILLLGETGVGKNTLAEWIHHRSPRNTGPFIEVNCASLPESLLESELFGYDKGAFTGALKSGKPGKVELAHEGTLFLNEIGEVPLHLQSKLLDFVQQKTMTRIGGTIAHRVNTRIIAATNRNLAQMVQDGLFRADLYYRLNVMPLPIPPLRDRPEDIPELVHMFLRRLALNYPQFAKQVDPDVVAVFQKYDWPGNVRELENVLERLVVSLEEEVISPGNLPENFQVIRPQEQDSPLQQLESVERSIYEEALKHYKSTYEIARALSVSQPTVVRKIKQFGLRK